MQTPVRLSASEKLPDLSSDDLHQPLSGFHRSPGDVRSDQQSAPVIYREQRTILRHRLFCEDVKPGSLDHPTVQRIRKIRFAEDPAASHIQQNRFRLHLPECFCIHQTFGMFIQRRMNGKNV